MITVTTDPAHKLVLAAMSGFLTPDDVVAFGREEQAAVEAMGLKSGEFYLLIDTSGTVIQPQDVVAAFQELALHAPLKARRIAVVRKSALTRMQTQRILQVRDNAAIFETLDEAKDWLFAA
jgi:hypothetical protein